MADYVKSVILRDTADEAAILLCGASDGSGESGVTKIDIDSTFTNFRPAATKIKKMKWSILGESVELYFDHTAAQTIGIFTGHGHLSEDNEAPITDKQGSGGTGDILLTTHTPLGSGLGTGYTIYLELKKVA